MTIKFAILCVWLVASALVIGSVCFGPHLKAPRLNRRGKRLRRGLALSHPDWGMKGDWR